MPQESFRKLKVKLQDLVDVSILQHVMNWFMLMTGVRATVRDIDGQLVTRPSVSTEFCTMVLSSQKGAQRCQESNVRAVRTAEQTKRPVKYVCHAGLSQYAAPIEVHGQCLGSIVLGDLPETPLDPGAMRELAGDLGLDPAQMERAARQVPLWSEEQMAVSVKFLHDLANMLATLCYQGYELRQALREMTVLSDVTRLLTSTLDLQQVLNLIVQKVTEVLGVKACSLRLLDVSGTDLVVKAVHNLSAAYLGKGPLLLERSEVDQKALLGEAVFVADMLDDPRIIYPKEAEQEGLRSCLAVALRFQNKAMGVLHIYTAERRDFDPGEVALFRALADAAAVAIENARLYQESVEKRYMENELTIAASIQSRLLPSSPPRFERVEIDARSVQSKRVGGDFYDFIPIGPDLLGVAIADVSGKGVPGALLMAAARSAFRALIESGVDTGQVVRRLNLSLVRDTGTDEFLSLFFAELNTRTLRFTYTSAGHNSPMLLRRGKIQLLEKGGMVLGVSERARFVHESLRLQSGDMIVLYTDGVTDARNRAGEMFGDERLEAIVRRLNSFTAAQSVETIHLEVEEFSEGVAQLDDRTVMVIRVK